MGRNVLRSNWGLLGVGVLACGFVAALAGPVRALNPQPEPPGRHRINFGLFRVTQDQSVSVGVVNVLRLKPQQLPPGPCRVTINFIDVAGNIVSQQSFDLSVEQSATAVFDGSGRRARPEVRSEVVTDPNEDLAKCGIIASTEVFDTVSGKATTHLDSPHFIGNPER